MSFASRAYEADDDDDLDLTIDFTSAPAVSSSPAMIGHRIQHQYGTHLSLLKSEQQQQQLHNEDNDLDLDVSFHSNNSVRRHVPDDDDKYIKARMQGLDTRGASSAYRQRHHSPWSIGGRNLWHPHEDALFLGYITKEGCCVLTGFACVLLLLFAAVLFGTGVSSLNGLQGPDPDDDDLGPVNGDFSLSGILDDILRTQRQTISSLEAIQSDQCAAGERLVLGAGAGASASRLRNAHKDQSIDARLLAHNQLVVLGKHRNPGVAEPHEEKQSLECTRILYFPNAVDPDFMDPAVHPCEDFYQYACGSYVTDSKNQGKDVTFSYLYRENMAVIEQLILADYEWHLEQQQQQQQQNFAVSTQANSYHLYEGDDDDDTSDGTLQQQGRKGRVGAFYSSCRLDQNVPKQMHSESREIQSLVDKILALDLSGQNATARLSELLGVLAYYDVDLPVRFSLELNPLSATQAVPTLIRSGLDYDIDGETEEWLQDLIRLDSGESGLNANTEGEFHRILGWLQLLPESVLPTREMAERWALKAMQMERRVVRSWVQSDRMLYAQRLGFSEYLKDYVNKDMIEYGTLKRTLSSWLDLGVFWKSLVDASGLVHKIAEAREQRHSASTGGMPSRLLLLREEFSDDTLFWTMNLQYMQTLSEELASTIQHADSESWRAYLLYMLLESTANDAGDSSVLYTYQHDYDPSSSLPWYRQPRFSVYEQLSSDVHQRCVQLTQTFLPVLLDDLFVGYLRKQFALQLQLGEGEEAEQLAWDTATAQILEMLQNIQKELQHELRDTVGTPAAIAAAEKIERIQAFIGVPRLWDKPGSRGSLAERDTLVISDAEGPSSYLDNMMRIRAFHQKLMVLDMYESVAFGPNSEPRRLYVERTKSWRTVQPPQALNVQEIFDSPVHQVNAFYQQQLNSITINAGIMLPPVYSTLYDVVSRYAKLGMVLGHELSHSIDLAGSYFDKYGSFHSFLTPEDAKLYQEHAQCFVQHYTGPTRYENIHNGALTVNENIADISGFRAAYNALFEERLKPLVLEMEDPATDLLSYKRQFFVAYAQVWCAASNHNAEARYIASSVHSTSEYRVNQVVQQHPDFQQVFGCSRFASSEPLCSTFGAVGHQT